jgi:hypothetical protein
MGKKTFLDVWPWIFFFKVNYKAFNNWGPKWKETRTSSTFWLELTRGNWKIIFSPFFQVFSLSLSLSLLPKLYLLNKIIHIWCRKLKNRSNMRKYDYCNTVSVFLSKLIVYNVPVCFIKLSQETQNNIGFILFKA